MLYLLFGYVNDCVLRITCDQVVYLRCIITLLLDRQRRKVNVASCSTFFKFVI
jgi:hypothetical protein